MPRALPGVLARVLTRLLPGVGALLRTRRLLLRRRLRRARLRRWRSRIVSTRLLRRMLRLRLCLRRWRDRTHRLAGGLTRNGSLVPAHRLLPGRLGRLAAEERQNIQA